MKPTPIASAAVSLAAVLALTASVAQGAGNLASKAIALKPLVMDKTLAFGPKEYTVQTGKYYQWHIKSQGGESFILKAPGLWDNVMVEKIVADDVEFVPGGGVKSISFDDGEASEIDIFFVPVSTGDFDFYAAGFEKKGMSGKFHIR